METTVRAELFSGEDQSQLSYTCEIRMRAKKQTNKNKSSHSHASGCWWARRALLASGCPSMFAHHWFQQPLKTATFLESKTPKSTPSITRCAGCHHVSSGDHTPMANEVSVRKEKHIGCSVWSIPGVHALAPAAATTTAQRIQSM